MKTTDNRWVVITGVIGLLAALLVGTGEFLLHYDPLARFFLKVAMISCRRQPTRAKPLGIFWGARCAFVLGWMLAYLFNAQAR